MLFEVKFTVKIKTLFYSWGMSKKSKISKLVVLLSLLSFTGVTTTAQAGPVLATYGDAWLEKIGDFPAVHLKGDEHTMGFQMGYLVGDLLKANMDDLRFKAEKNVGNFMKYVPMFIFKGLRRSVGMIFWSTFSDDVKDNIEGVVAGAKARPDHVKLEKYDLAFLNSLIDITGMLNAAGENLNKDFTQLELLNYLGMPTIHANCDSFAAWGPRTVDGKTFQTRNTDIDTGKGIEKYPIIIVIKRDGKIPVVSTSLTGMVGVFAGMNAYGVGLGQVWTHSLYTKLQTPWQLQVRELFMNAKSASEAVVLFSKMNKVAYGSNFIFADAGDGADGSHSEAFAIEASSREWSVFSPNDPRELFLKYNDQSVGLPIPYAIARGDLYLDLGLRSHQTSANGPNGDPHGSGGYDERYKGQIDRILAYEQQGVKISGAEAIKISQDTAMRDGNLINAVYGNTDRELWVSYARMNDDGTETQAYAQDYTHIPFYEYLSTVSRNSNGSLRIDSYLDSKKSPREMMVRVSRKGSEISKESVSLVQASIELPKTHNLKKGDLVELLDAKDGTLVDRLAL